MRNVISLRRSPRLGGGFHPSMPPVVAATTYELVPLKNLEGQLPNLPKGAHVSVTCSPQKGIDATLDLSERLQGDGLIVTPHLAARLFRDRQHTDEVAARIKAAGFAEAFVIAGDAEQPAGDYLGAVEFLRDFAGANHGLERIGVTGYPDGHLFLDNAKLGTALRDKQGILADAGMQGWVSTQMCFDPGAITKWLRAERQAGLALPVRLGIPGPIDRTKLLTMGMRVGVGQSLRYLQKNRAGLQRLATSAYDPNKLLTSIGDLAAWNISGLHLFTFNQLDSAVAWRDAVLTVCRRP